MGKGFFMLPRFLKKLLSHPSVILQAAFRLERPTRVYLGHVKNVVAPPPDQHAQEHVQSKEWSGSSCVNFPMAVTKVFFKGHPKHFVLKPSLWEKFSTTAAPSRSA